MMKHITGEKWTLYNGNWWLDTAGTMASHTGGADLHHLLGMSKLLSMVPQSRIQTQNIAGLGTESFPVICVR